MSTARYGCAAVVLNGDVVVMGGVQPDGSCISSVERYDRRRQCWEPMPSMTPKRAYFGAGVLQFLDP